MINLPNLLTLFRFFLVILMILFFIPFLEKSNPIDPINSMLIFSFFFYVIASITDFLDGKLARKYNKITKLGTFLDPLADKLLILSFFLLVYLYPPTRYFLIFFVVICIREIGITFLRIYCLHKEIQLKTEKHGKLKTNVQIISQFLLWGAIFYSNYATKEIFFFQILPYFCNSLLFLVSAITIYSGISYLKK